MKLEIVSHCVNYSKFATFQISSILQNPPPAQHELSYTFCYADDDEKTAALVDFFSRQVCANIRWQWMALERGRANRRAIGRDLAAHASTADWVWFIDADYCFGPECFKALMALLDGRNEVLLFPKQVRTTTHEDGEALVRELDKPALIRVPFDRFTLKQSFRRAIGGIQIARGDIVRERGYAGGRRRRPAATWQKPREDVTFRRSLGTRGTPIELADLFRMRHRPWKFFSGSPPF